MTDTPSVDPIFKRPNAPVETVMQPTWRHLVNWSKVVVIFGQVLGILCLCACSWNGAVLTVRNSNHSVAWAVTIGLGIVGAVATIASTIAAWRAAGSVSTGDIEKRQALLTLAGHSFDDEEASALLQKLASKVLHRDP